MLAPVALVAAAISLAACGRNGNPLPPPGPVATETPPAPGAAPSLMPGTSSANAAATAQATAQKNGFDAQGNPVAAAGQKKSFPLDPLLQ